METKKEKKERRYPKKSYYLPERLIDYFVKWCKPGREYSAKVGAGILLYMSVTPTIREKAEKLSDIRDPDAAIKEMRSLMQQEFTDNEIVNFVNSLKGQEKAQVFERMRELVKQFSVDK